MTNILKTIIGDFGDKKDWKVLEARAKALPKDYRVVYNEIKRYFWSGAGPLRLSMDLYRGLLDLFEEGVSNGKSVLEITGEDVATFCDELVRGEITYAENLRSKLNNSIKQKIRK